MNKRLRDVAAASLLSITISIILAIGHVKYGTQFTSISGEDILLLDSYVFFLSYGFLTTLSLTFFYFKEDITETISVFLTGFWALTFGFLDLVVYLILGYTRETYPWLQGTPAGITAQMTGTQVTTTQLILNTAAFGLITLSLIILLVDIEHKIKLGELDV